MDTTVTHSVTDRMKSKEFYFLDKESNGAGTNSSMYYKLLTWTSFLHACYIDIQQSEGFENQDEPDVGQIDEDCCTSFADTEEDKVSIGRNACTVEDLAQHCCMD